ncbi:MAG: PhzF family phenazine biosynthesis protein [Bacteroidota bacterium]
MNIRYHTCDVFTDRQFGGNQLAVVPDAAGIPEHLLQSIAQEFNFSETTFVYPPIDSRNTKRIRIFTPQDELPFAGHPTVGTAVVLAAIGEIHMPENSMAIVLEEGVGPVPVTITSENGLPSFAQLTAAKPPEFNDSVPPAESLAAMLTVSRNDLDDGTFPVQSVSVGYPFLYVAVKNRDVLKRIRVNTQVMEELNLKEVYVFTQDAEHPKAHFRSRMFAPLLGIPEDPATGSAAASFAGYLARRDPLRTGMLKWTIEQGIEMGRPSRLFIEAEKREGEITAIRVGGNVVVMSEGTLIID